MTLENGEFAKKRKVPRGVVTLHPFCKIIIQTVLAKTGLKIAQHRLISHFDDAKDVGFDFTQNRQPRLDFRFGLGFIDFHPIP